MIRILHPPPPTSIGVAGWSSIVGAGQLQIEVSPMQKDSIARNRSISTVRDRFQNSADRLLTQIGSLRNEQISFTPIAGG